MRLTDQAFDAFLINNSVHLLIKNYAHNLCHAHLNFFALWQKAAIKKKKIRIYILGDWNCHFLGMKQIIEKDGRDFTFLEVNHICEAEGVV